MDLISRKKKSGDGCGTLLPLSMNSCGGIPLVSIIITATSLFIVSCQFSSAHELQSALRQGSLATTTTLAASSIDQNFDPTIVVAATEARRISGEPESFIMQTTNETLSASNLQQASNAEQSTTTSMILPPTTTIPPTTQQVQLDKTDDQRIAIDTNRQQFVTHDQLQRETRDEQVAVETSRGSPKVSHVSSILTDLIAYATRPRISHNYQSVANDQVSQDALGGHQSPLPQPTDNQQHQAPANAKCAGFCRSILVASFLSSCTELVGSCPSHFQKCCDSSDASALGTLVETSAPLLPTATETDGAHLAQASSLLASASASGSDLEQRTRQTTPMPSTQPASTAPAVAVDQPQQQQHQSTTADGDGQQQSGVDTDSKLPDPVYFLSSTGDEPTTAATDTNMAHTGVHHQHQHQPQPVVSNGASATNAATSTSRASQSFDLPLSSTTTTTTAISIEHGKVQTANGTILQQSHAETKRVPLYVSMADYQHRLAAAAASNPRVNYHPNTEPVRRSNSGSSIQAPASTTAPNQAPVQTATTQTPSAANQPARQASDLSARSQNSEQQCIGLCMEFKNRHFCKSPNYTLKCEDVSYFCCMHSDSSTGGTATTTASTASLSTTIAMPEPPHPATTKDELATPTSSDDQSFGVGGVFAHLFDSLVSSMASSSPVTEPPLTHLQPVATNDRRVGLAEVSFRQVNNSISAAGQYQPDNGATSSDGGVELGGNDESNSVVTPCSGYCAKQIFAFLCDSTYTSADCGSGRTCCVNNGGSQASTQTRLNYNPQGLVAAPSDDQLQQQQVCPGQCLSYYQLSICARPTHDLVSAADRSLCPPGELCCAPVAAPSLNDSGASFQVDGIETQTTRDIDQNKELFAALIPPAPAGVDTLVTAPGDEQAVGARVEAPSASARSRPMQPPLLNQQHQALVFDESLLYALQHQQQQLQSQLSSHNLPHRPHYQHRLLTAAPTTTTAIAASTTSAPQTTSQGIMSQLYSIFRPSAAKQSGRQQPSPVRPVQQQLPQLQHQPHQQLQYPYQQQFYGGQRVVGPTYDVLSHPLGHFHQQQAPIVAQPQHIAPLSQQQLQQQHPFQFGPAATSYSPSHLSVATTPAHFAYSRPPPVQHPGLQQAMPAPRPQQPPRSQQAQPQPQPQPQSQLQSQAQLQQQQQPTYNPPQQMLQFSQPSLGGDNNNRPPSVGQNRDYAQHRQSSASRQQQQSQIQQSQSQIQPQVQAQVQQQQPPKRKPSVTAVPSATRKPITTTTTIATTATAPVSRQPNEPFTRRRPQPEALAAAAADKSDAALAASDVSLGTVASPTQHQPNQLQQPSCGVPGGRSGKQRSGRVIGGKDVGGDEYCWQAALMNERNEYLCGGTLIGAKWVLTAGHCVAQHLRNETSQLFVRLGQTDLNDATSASSNAKTVLVKYTYINHNHNSQTLDNDIALLRLDEPVPLDGDTGSSICLACLPERNAEPTVGARCAVAGFGYKTEDGPAALKLRATHVPIVTDVECQSKTEEAIKMPFALPTNSFCAGGELGSDACAGDGGSPLTCADENGVHEIVGIVSWGFKCATTVPSVYVKVSAFVGWINQIVSANN